MLNEALLEEKLTALEKARSWSPRVVSKLETFVRSGDDFSLFRVNPLRFAAEKGVAEGEAVDLFLHAVKLGLFQMNWQLLCPGCSTVVKSFGTLRTLDSHLSCNLCQIDVAANLDDYIAISFTVAPTVRDIAFNHPERLSIEDFYFKYQFSREAYVPVEGSPRFTDAVRLFLKGLAYVEPGRTQSFELELGPGMLVGLDRVNQSELYVQIKAGAPAGPARIKLVNSASEPKQSELAPGRRVVEVENLSARRAAVALLHFPPEHKSMTLGFDPFLSGKKLLTTQTFRDLFQSETTRGTEGLGVKEITVLFTDLKGSTALYDRIGDLKAFALVQQHFERLSKVVQAESGATVKTIGEAVMASILRPSDAVRAALRMLEEIERFNAEYGEREIILKIGVHKGASIVVTQNERLDFFGQTVNIAARVQGLAEADEILITEDVHAYPGVAELLKDSEVSRETARLKGIQDEVRVYRVKYKARARSASN